MSPPVDALDAGLRLARALEEAGVSYALGGALAYGVWSVPRGTNDVDINAFVQPGDLPKLVRALVSVGIEMKESQALADAQHEGMFMVWYGGFRIDVFVPSIAFAWEAERTRRRHEIDGQGAWFLSAEALSVFKLMFFRGKDVVDLERLIAVQGANLDHAYVRRHIVEMMGEEDERTKTWDRLVAAFGESEP